MIPRQSGQATIRRIDEKVGLPFRDTLLFSGRRDTDRLIEPRRSARLVHAMRTKVMEPSVVCSKRSNESIMDPRSLQPASAGWSYRLATSVMDIGTTFALFAPGVYHSNHDPTCTLEDGWGLPWR